MENRIKEQQRLDLFADRTNTHWMASNQLRLWFSAVAPLVMSTLQAEVLRGTDRFSDHTPRSGRGRLPQPRVVRGQAYSAVAAWQFCFRVFW